MATVADNEQHSCTHKTFSCTISESLASKLIFNYFGKVCS